MDYTQPYEKTFAIMSEKERFSSLIADRTLSRWAFDASIIIIANPFIIDRNYAEFKNGGANFVRRRYTAPPLLRKSHPVINEDFCILPCALRTRLQYMCFSDC